MSNLKDFIAVFFDSASVAHHAFLPEDPTLNKQYDLEVMRPLRETRQKMPGIVEQSVMEIAPGHTSLLACIFLLKTASQLSIFSCS